ncbi:hypothetical protein CCHR01_05260 [Colletotrichum chrysophilum]|uniref:Uncharacterized protein n=1 Tax=Colletotrichum chrysophilum TaxID=1836956 RepID=A0AAD9EKW9_9PEZI|nr:hypothetical protein CCHR01_05260 [Colletotrichum chrysophilum]
MIALLGIVAELQEHRNDSFATKLGVWEHGLAEQLLWRHSDTPCEDYSCIPPEMLMRPGFAGEKDHAERVPIYHVGGIRSVLGCGVFDSGARVLECFCFPLIFEEREKGDPSYVLSRF